MAGIDDLEAYKKHKAEKHQEMLMKQNVPYSIKRRMSKDRIREFIREARSRGLNTHVSVGGLDSIVLGHLIREMGYGEDEVPFVSASSLEDVSIQKVPGKFHGLRSLVGYSPWGRKESDTTERLHFHFMTY